MVLLYSPLAGYKGQGLDYRDCLNECVQLVTGLVKVVEWKRVCKSSAEVFLSVEETSFAYTQ